MRNLLIGHNGFVGSNLKEIKSLKINYFAGKKEISNYQNTNFDIIFCAAPQAKKWLANKNPEFDLNEINNLVMNLQDIKCNLHFILFSTIDIYSPPIEVDEDTIQTNKIHYYGLHRRILESKLKKLYGDKFKSIRLPALVGKNLKKNIIYDLLENNNVENINMVSKFQWFNLKHIEYFINYLIEKNISKLNISSEPIYNYEIVERFFSEYSWILNNRNESTKAEYNMFSKYTLTNSKYFFSKEEVLNNHLKSFIEDYKN